jgi:hypothetical protein
MVVQRETGSVRLKKKGASGFKRVSGSTLVPFGSTVDVTDGRAAVITAPDATRTQRFELSLGQAKITQSAGSVSATMVGGDKGACRHASRSSEVLSSKRRPPPRIRRIRLQSNGHHAPYKVQGTNTAAISGGTDFTMEDRCDGTATRVKKGTVELSNQYSPTTPTLNPGESSVDYCAFRGFPNFGATCLEVVSQRDSFFTRIDTTIYAGTYELCITAPNDTERCHAYDLGPNGRTAPPSYPTDVRSAESLCAGAKGGLYRARWKVGSRQLGVPLFFNRLTTSSQQNPDSGTCFEEATLVPGGQQYVSKPTAPPFRYSQPG